MGTARGPSCHLCTVQRWSLVGAELEPERPELMNLEFDHPLIQNRSLFGQQTLFGVPGLKKSPS